MPASVWSALNQHREKHWLCTCFYYDTFLMFFLSFQSASCKWFKMWAPPSLSSTIALLRPRGSLTVGHAHRASGGLCWWASSLAVGSKEGLNENRDWNQMGLSQKLCSTTWTDVTSLSQCCSFYTCLYVHCAQTSMVGSGIQLWTQHCSSPDGVHSQIRKVDVYRDCYNPPCQLLQYLLDRSDAAWGESDSTEEFTGTEKHYRKKSIAEAASWEKMACSGDANSSLWLG